MSPVGGGLGLWGLRATRGTAAVAWHILPVSNTPFFPRGLWEESNRATFGVSHWMAGGVDSGPLERPRGCVHAAPTTMQVLTNPPDSRQQAPVINKKYGCVCVIDLNAKSVV